MKELHLVVLSVAVLLIAGNSYGQGYRVPSHYSFSDKESYHKYDKDIIRYANWLEKIAPGDEEGNVKMGSRFFGEWLSGCSYVQYRQNFRVDGVLSDCPEYMKYYEAGYVRYALKNQGNPPSKVESSYAGLKMVLKVYAENRGMKKYPGLDDLLKLEDDGKLKAWVQSRIE